MIATKTDYGKENGDHGTSFDSGSSDLYPAAVSVDALRFRLEGYSVERRIR